MKTFAPYQLFFPLGVFSAFIGVGLWLFQALLPLPVILVHSRIMLGGFLWSFISGFLMTAVPRMSGTKAAGPFEVATAFALVLLQIGFSFLTAPLWFYGTNALLILFLIFFAGRRVTKATKVIPVFFSHVGLALILAIAGCYFYSQNNRNMGIYLYHVGPLLLLILGIGTRFFSFLSGLPSAFENLPSLPLRILFHGLGFSVVLCVILAGADFAFANLLLVLISFLYFIFIWKIYRPSAHRSALKYAVRTVALMIPLSFFLLWINPSGQIAWLHLLFIGSFSLLTFSVATRVTLAHGSYPLLLEKSFSLWIFMALLILSLAFRVAYGLSYSSDMLKIAVFFWLSALLIWSGTFGIKILKPGPLKKPSC